MPIFFSGSADSSNILMTLPRANGGMPIPVVDPGELDFVHGSAELTFHAWATPIVRADSFGIRYEDNFGLRSEVFSPSGVNPIISWQMARFMSESLRRLRLEPAQASTLQDLYALLLGKEHRLKNLSELAEDFDVTVERLTSEVEQARAVYPTPGDICLMWDKVHPARRVMMAYELESAIAGGYLVPDQRLEKRLLGRRKEREMPVAQMAPRLPVSSSYGIVRHSLRVPLGPADQYRLRDAVAVVKRLFGI